MSDEEKQEAQGGVADWMSDEGWEADMSRPSFGTPRFWMPSGTEKKVIFLTDVPKIIWEHQYATIRNGKRNFFNWATCLLPLDLPCPMCAQTEYRRYKGAFFTVIDLSEYEDRSGQKHKNEKKLLVAKSDVFSKLKRQATKRKEAGESLRGALYTVYRSASDTSPGTGDTFEFESMVDLEKLDDSEEFDYAELLAPDPEKMKQIVQEITAGQGGTGSAPGGSPVEY